MLFNTLALTLLLCFSPLLAVAGSFRAYFYDGAECAGRDRGYEFKGHDDQSYGNFDLPKSQGGDGSNPKSMYIVWDNNYEGQTGVGEKVGMLVIAGNAATTLGRKARYGSGCLTAPKGFNIHRFRTHDNGANRLIKPANLGLRKRTTQVIK